jgi:hypothetical protein
MRFVEGKKQISEPISIDEMQIITESRIVQWQNIYIADARIKSLLK